MQNGKTSITRVLPLLYQMKGSREDHGNPHQHDFEIMKSKFQGQIRYLPGKEKYTLESILDACCVDLLFP